MCQFWHRFHGKETKKKNKEEKKIQPDPLCYAYKACHNHTKGHTADLQYPWKGSCHPPHKPKINYMGWIVDDNTPADDTTVITSEDDTIVIGEIKS